jgi:hypothetical protein
MPLHAQLQEGQDQQRHPREQFLPFNKRLPHHERVLDKHVRHGGQVGEVYTSIGKLPI